MSALRLLAAAGCLLALCTASSDVDYLCATRHDGILLPHPADCGLFVECFHHVAYVKECGHDLRFNPKKGICDYKNVVPCDADKPKRKEPEPYKPAPPVPEAPPRPYYPDYHRPRQPYREPARDEYRKPARDEYREPHRNEYRKPARGEYREPYRNEYREPARNEYREPVRDYRTYQSPRPTYEETVFGAEERAPAKPTGEGSISSEARGMISSRMRDEAAYAKKMERVVDSAAFRYVSSFLNAKPYGKYLGLSAMFSLQAQRLVMKRFGLGKADLMNALQTRMRGRSFLRPLAQVARPDMPMPVPEDMDVCPYPKQWSCDPYAEYRSIDGSCNNLHQPILGRSMIPLRRLLPAVYGDGLETMRRSVTGGPLPGPRDISLRLFPDRDVEDGTRTLMLMNFGQFVDHDITHTAITKMAMKEGDFSKEEMTEVKCGFDGCESGTADTQACWPIPVPDTDYDFKQNKCMKFVRSQEVPPLSCSYAPREQLNQVTSWLDASAIYGSSSEEAERLRQHDRSRGRMDMAAHPHGNKFKPMLPKDRDVELCRDVNETISCFAAGDERVNEQAGLSTIHLMWVREHNKIEEELHHLNPHWDGEKLYQETRRIISAMLQHIVYNEYLPTVIGPELSKRHHTALLKEGYYNGYDASVDPRATNSFATAAYRFGHTLIHERVRRAFGRDDYDDSTHLSQLFHRPAALYDTARGGVDSFIRGMCESSCQSFDSFFTKQVSKSLFTEHPPHGIGMDLLSLNIQRGRDHGLPSYNAFRELCGLRPAYSFDDLAQEIPNYHSRQLLAKVYKSVDDIDLFAGGVAERSVAGGLVGPTFGCIIGKQFGALRKGDRFWYENGHGKQAFSPAQLASLRRSMLATVYCTNSESIDVIQPWVLASAIDSRDDRELLAAIDESGDKDVWFESLSYAKGERGDQPALLRQLLRDSPELLNKRSPFNIRVPCKMLPSLDLRAWREQPYGSYHK